jgi:NTE family protein
MPKPKVGIALGAGGARGLANLGVLQVLHEEGIPIHVVTGTSAGAVIGSLYSAGTDLAMIGRLAEELEWDDLTSFTLARKGLVSPDKIHSMLRVLTKDQDFEDLPIPTAVVATDLLTGQEVVVDSGPIALGVRASLAIPGVFVPLELDGRLLVDGALVNRVPADLCHKMGADVVIAVDVGWAPLRGRIRNLPDVIMRTIDVLQRQVAQHKSIQADIVLEPELGNVTITQLNRAREIIDKGREVALANLANIKRQLELASTS